MQLAGIGIITQANVEANSARGKADPVRTRELSVMLKQP
jgi:hypothetical protein